MDFEDKVIKELESIKDMIDNLRAIVVVLAGDKVNRI